VREIERVRERKMCLRVWGGCERGRGRERERKRERERERERKRCV
jgi:hypothetical protein